MNAKLKRLNLSGGTQLIALGLSLLAVTLIALLLARDATTTLAALPNDVCLVAAPQRYDPSSGLSLLAPRPVPDEARCPVCGMYPARAPASAAQLIYINGDAHFFDSPLSLCLYLNAVARYSPGRSATDVAVTYVTAAETGRWTPTGQAFYVCGSTALGPMRNGNLTAFASEFVAQRFAQQHGGKVLNAGDISPALLGALDTQPTHMHSMH